MSDKIKILVTGANGQLGSELRELETVYTQFDFTFTDVAELNILDIDALNSFFADKKFDFLVNCAAYTAVDKAEQEKDRAYQLNTVAIDYLVEMAQKYKFFLVQISTDYVFDGTKNNPYNEEDVPIPESQYGKTKLDAEHIVLDSEINAVVIRTSWLYSTYGNNYVKTMLRLAGERSELNIVFDQTGTPTYAYDLADAILQIIPQLQAAPKPFRDVYHYSNEGVCSWYDFTQHIFRHCGVACKVNPIGSEQYPTLGHRPTFSVLDKTKIKKRFNLLVPYWVDSLDIMLDKLKSKQ